MNRLDQLDIILSVIDEEYSNDIYIEDVIKNRHLLKSIVKLAKRNGLYYYLILRLKELGMDITSLNENQWVEELDRLSKFKNTFSFLDNMKNSYGIDYILIKACTTIPHVPRDIDILVHTEDIEKVFDVFKKNDMIINYSNNVETSFHKEGYMKLDIYNNIQYMSIEFIDNEFLWSSKIEDNMYGIKFPSLRNETNFILLLAHSIFGHGSMTLLDFLDMTYLLNNIKNINVCRNYAYDKGWGCVFEMSLERLELIHDTIYKDREMISFPYLFDKKFMMRCISSMNLNTNRYEKGYISISIMLDRLAHNLRDTPIYDHLLSFNEGRRLFNSLGYFVRNRRGDRHGLNIKKVNN